MPEAQQPASAQPDQPDDQRERFKAALDAKKGKSPGNPHAQASGGGPAKEHSSRSGGKREFRRKSGG